MISLSERISEYFCQLCLERIPSEKIYDIKCLILDFLGVALRGSETMSGRIAIQYALNQNSHPTSTIIGANTQASPELAAFANAISSHSIELDDVDDLALFHYSPSIASAALAVAEKLKSSGRDLIRAIYAGCEMMARLSNAMNPSLRNRGFHTTPVCGCIGTAVSVGLLLELNQHKMTNAVALAGSQSCGLMEFYGDSLQKRFNTGPPARNGICAAEMASLGFSGAAEIIEGRRGFFRAFSDNHNEAAFLDGLGEKFPVYIDFKPYASARPIHNGIDCALEIRNKHSVASKDIRKITIYRHPAWADFHLIYNPKNINEAQVSLPFSVAVAFKEGEAFLEHYEDPYLSDPEINRVMDAVRVKPMEKLPRGVSCLMVVETTNGDKYQSQIDYPKGSRQNPIKEKALIKKFKRLSSNMIDSTAGDRIVEMILNLDSLENLNDLITYFRAGS